MVTEFNHLMKIVCSICSLNSSAQCLSAVLICLFSFSRPMRDILSLHVCGLWTHDQKQVCIVQSMKLSLMQTSTGYNVV